MKIVDYSNAVSLSKDARLLVRKRHIFLVNANTLDWVAVPINLADALKECLGKNLKQIEAVWHYSELSARDLIQKLGDAHLLENNFSTPSISIPPFSIPQKPLLVVLQLTGACDMACTYCYNEAGSRKQRMSFETLKNSVDFAFEYKQQAKSIHFHFHGGEPLVNWNILERGAQYISNEGNNKNIAVRLTVATNGLHLDKQKIRTLAKYNVGIRISFDGLPMIHDLYRRTKTDKPTSDKVLKTLDLLAGYPEFCVLITVTRKSSSFIPDIVRFMLGKSTPAIQFQFCRLLGYAHGNTELKTDAKSYIEGLKNVVAMIDNDEIHDIKIETILRLLLPLLTKGSVHGSNCQDFRCGAGRNSLYIDTTGEIRGCDMLPEIPNIRLGNIIDRINLAALDEVTKPITKNSTKCRKCPWTNLCRGGCPGAAWSDEGSFALKHKLSCEIASEMYPFLLERLCDKNSKLIGYFNKHCSI